MAGSKKNNRIYIIGAGFTGTAIASEICAKGIFGRVVAFLDDDADKIGSKIGGVPVLGPIGEVVSLLRQTPADEALIAMPGASREKLKDLFQLLKKAEFAKIRILPGISQIVEGAAHLIQAREIDPQDLLARSPVTINLTKSLAYLRGKRVLITGAGGSIGSELSRQLLSGGASRLYLFGHGENSIYEIDRDLRILQEEGVGEKATIVPVIGDLKDADYTRFIFSRLKADVIFHCAAYKHVPMSEANPVEVIRNNVFGTRHLVEAASEAGSERVVFISTDKAVGPASVYGASKKIAEEIVVQARAKEGLDFIVVRFGNVLGSRGSIVPLFRRQILKGGPLTITHPEASRFFMTIPEAASLVLQAGGVGEGGNLYVLDMGDPLLIKDLAEQMIRFYGFEPEKDIPIVPVGLRPGEKLSENLWDSNEKMETTRYRKINRIIRGENAFPAVDELLAKLAPVCFRDPLQSGLYRNRKILREILSSVIPYLEAPADEPEY
ncbi:MAG: polysaccharide biosynthesis protein [Spirochaetales bacterium]|jgi:FlaA1/EpsC-like NDP-sugar epimerase|nr:polysaccharide biosynthesis protein [Spirochaetales bacterium]